MELDLSKIRDEIDGIDTQITELLTRRMNLSIEVAAYKKANNLPIYHPEREIKVIEKVTSKTKPEYTKAMTIIYQSIMDQGKIIQETEIKK